MRKIWIGFHDQIHNHTKERVTVITHPEILARVTRPDEIILFGDFTKLPHWQGLKGKIKGMNHMRVKIV